MAIAASVYYANYGNGTTTGYFATSVWATGTALPGNRRRPTTPTTGNERIFVCTTGGTNTTQPTWPTTAGAKATDGSTAVTWYEVSGQPGLNGDIGNCPVWATSQSVAVGTVIFVAGNSTLQIATQASGGTTGAGSAPAFSATAGNTVADNTVTWTSLGAASNYAGFSTPLARVQTAVAAGWVPAGGTLYISAAHAETQSTAMTINSGAPGNAAPLMSVISVDAGQPIGALTLMAGASIATSANAIFLNAGFYMWGVTIAGFSNLTISGNSGLNRFENCQLGIGGTATSARITFNGSPSGGNNNTFLEFINTSLFFGNASQQALLSNSVTRWVNSTAVTSATLPNTLFGGATVSMFTLTCIGVDFSNLTGTLVTSQFPTGQVYFVNCKTNASATIAVTPTAYSSAVTDLICSDSSGTNYNFGRWRYQGTLVPDTMIVATGGASNGTTQYSYKITTTANSTWLSPFEAIPITIWNTTAGSTVTATVRGIWNQVSLPDNDQVWMAIEYLGSASSPLASVATGTISTVLSPPSAQSASTRAWDSQVAARQNSHGYALGETIKVSDNVGRVFFCTTAGSSASSEPGGYAGAVDGGSVTDGTAVFRAGVRFHLALALSSPAPALAGYLQAYIRVAAASTTVWIDPLIALT